MVKSFSFLNLLKISKLEIILHPFYPIFPCPIKSIELGCLVGEEFIVSKIYEPSYDCSKNILNDPIHEWFIFDMILLEQKDDGYSNTKLQPTIYSNCSPIVVWNTKREELPHKHCFCQKFTTPKNKPLNHTNDISYGYLPISLGLA